MTRKVPLTEEERQRLLANPFTAKVTKNGQVSHTVAFKKFAYEQHLKGVKTADIVKMAGYDLNSTNKNRYYKLMERIIAEAQSEQGFKDPLQTKKLQKKRIEELQTKQALKTLQDRVIYLEQELDFLKKIYSLEKLQELGK